jgi:hypothetical protein
MVVRLPCHIIGERRRDVSRLCRHTSSALQALSPVLVRRQAGLWILFHTSYVFWSLMRSLRDERKERHSILSSRSCRFYGQFYGRLRCCCTSILSLFIDFSFLRLHLSTTALQRHPHSFLLRKEHLRRRNRDERTSIPPLIL